MPRCAMGSPFRSDCLSLYSNRTNGPIHIIGRSVLFSLFSVCSFFATMHYFVVYHYSGDPDAPSFIYGAFADEPPSPLAIPPDNPDPDSVPFKMTSSVSSTTAFELNVKSGTLTIDVVLTNITAESYSWVKTELKDSSNTRKPEGAEHYAVAPLFHSTPPIGHPTCYYINRTKISCTFTPERNFYISADMPVTIVINKTSLHGPAVYCQETSEYFKTERVKNNGQYLFFGWPAEYERKDIPIGKPIVGSVSHDGINYTATLVRDDCTKKGYRDKVLKEAASDTKVNNGIAVGQPCSRRLFAADSKNITWQDAPEQLLSANLDDKNVLEVLHYADKLDGTAIGYDCGVIYFSCIYDITFKAVYANGTEVRDRELEYLVFDGEGTKTGGDNPESIIVTTNGTNFTMVELFGSTSVASTGNGTKTVTFDTENSKSYPVFSSMGNDVNFNVQTVLGASGQGAAFAVRVFCDYSNKGTPNYLNGKYEVRTDQEIGQFIISNFKTPTPTATPSKTATVSGSHSQSESATISVSPTRSESPTVSLPPTPSKSPTHSESITESTSASESASLSPTVSVSPTPSESPTVSLFLAPFNVYISVESNREFALRDGQMSVVLTMTNETAEHHQWRSVSDMITEPQDILSGADDVTVEGVDTRSRRGEPLKEIPRSLTRCVTPIFSLVEGDVVLFVKEPDCFLLNKTSLKCSFHADSTFKTHEDLTVEVRVNKSHVVSPMNWEGCRSDVSVGNFTVFDDVVESEPLAGENSVLVAIALSLNTLILFIGGPWMEVQCMILAMRDLCSPSADQKASRYAMYLISPFYEMGGYSWGIIGNVLLVLFVSVLHHIYLVLRNRFIVHQKNTVITAFPSILFSAGIWAYVGIVYCTFCILFLLMSSSPETNPNYTSITSEIAGTASRADMNRVMGVSLAIGFTVMIGLPVLMSVFGVWQVRRLKRWFYYYTITKQVVIERLGVESIDGAGRFLLLEEYITMMDEKQHTVKKLSADEEEANEDPVNECNSPGAVSCVKTPNFDEVMYEGCDSFFDDRTQEERAIALRGDDLPVLPESEIFSDVVESSPNGRMLRIEFDTDDDDVQLTDDKQHLMKRVSADEEEANEDPVNECNSPGPVSYFKRSNFDERKYDHCDSYSDTETLRHERLKTQERNLRHLCDEWNESVNSAGAARKVPRLMGTAKRLFLPIGFWGYRYAEMNFEYGQYGVGWRQLCAGYPFLLSIPIAIMCAISADHPRRPKGPFPPEGRCMVTSVIVMLWFLVMAILVAVLRPYRILFTSIMTSIALVFCSLVCLLMLLDVTFAVHLLPLVLLLISVLMRTCNIVYVWWWERSQHDPIWRERYYNTVQQSGATEEYNDLPVLVKVSKRDVNEEAAMRGEDMCVFEGDEEGDIMSGCAISPFSRRM